MRLTRQGVRDLSKLAGKPPAKYSKDALRFAGILAPCRHVKSHKEERQFCEESHGAYVEHWEKVEVCDDCGRVLS